MKYLFRCYVNVFKNYFNFQGRANRTEFWVFSIVYYTVLIGSSLLSDFLIDDNGVMQGTETQQMLLFVYLLIILVFSIVMIIPLISVCYRRFHDTGKSGALFIVLNFIPFVGVFIILFIVLKKGDKGINAYGEPVPVDKVFLNLDKTKRMKSDNNNAIISRR